ncbi:MAG: arginine--tRNA ligase [Candidatus Niyogibacteria bacterium RIFCSPLOWO2_01_FULL_45_48]|uniref:Arginine--tRNA ligase n=2 Tax=Candidatus Niyogiibacteriota TaxID=1817912 RepID=A0A1G2EWJ5_9BACT|nr:MAG: arginine--tRNA ligase [Candidatus Niyogibacteria bacterium RIFCSPHIGHO2_01_FULL_45_28]OGZ30169.1 MAG: arginine--tRNA ligase [Candidatus Niyogibacteria bacterium RIFCSPLOWO2_02_FULL_45_13]OGZ30915.1 MAG: arginine--tRNA ligase [Candidatus Niyogibacteria bacterium RIFCSPLOWO2_01_FULL_45_48]
MIRGGIIKEIKKIAPKDAKFSVSRPERPAFGDYSSNVAMVVAKKFGKNSRELAEDFKEKLGKSKLFERIDVAGPGFLNFWISPEVVGEGFLEFARAKGLPKFNIGKNKKIQVEYVSANPTGPLTLANGRGGFLGDILSSVLALVGFKVEREYYINDTGKQIITLGKSMLASAGLIPDEETFYKGGYIKDWAKKNKAKIKKLGKDPLKLGQEAAKDFLKSIKNTLKSIAKIKFDRWTSEDKYIHKKNWIKKAQALFEKKNMVYEKDGATWLKTTDFADDKDRVLITSDGYPTYFLADAGHYFESVVRGFKKKINILGPDHYGYVARIQAVAEIVGMEDSEIIVTQTVRLMKGGEEFKMSKRKGTFVAFEELIDEIGLDAARWFFLGRSSDTHIDIDLEFAKKQSAENPVYYVQYAHARMSGILRKAQVHSVKRLAFGGFKKDELKFIKKLLEVSDVLEDVARDYQAHRLTAYVYELAQAFSAFYRDVKVLDSGSDEPRRLFIIKSAKNTLGSLLKLLGISAPERM